jgi:lysine-arginine-ornithine-binding protein
MKRVTGPLYTIVLSLLINQPLIAQEVVTIATEGAYPPFNMKNAKGELTGFDVEIADALCKAMDRPCKIVSQDWDGIIPGLLAKKYDAIIASMSITAERQRKVAFTAPYYSNYLRLITKKGSGILPTRESLKGKRVGAQRATISAQYAEDNFRKVATVKVYDTQEAAYLDIQAGRLDAIVTDIYPGHDWLQKPENSDYTFSGEPVDINDKIGIAVRKQDKRLKSALNQALKAIVESGEYQRINANYFPFSIR